MVNPKMKEAQAKAKLLKRAKSKVKRGVRVHKGSATDAEWRDYQDSRIYHRQQAHKEYERRKKARAERAARVGLLKRLWNWIKRVVSRRKAD